jgi:DNA repair protein RadC
MKTSAKIPQPRVAEVQLKYRSKIKASDRPQVKSSQDAYNLFSELWDQDTIELFEHFKLMLLSKSNRVLGMAEISAGGSSGTIVDIKIILQYVIKANASGIIVCHNHPSCNLTPSDADVRITRKIKEAANLIDVQLLDHLILTAEDKYYSFSDDGII